MLKREDGFILDCLLNASLKVKVKANVIFRVEFPVHSSETSSIYRDGSISRLPAVITVTPSDAYPQVYINELIIWILNLLVVPRIRLMDKKLKKVKLLSIFKMNSGFNIKIRNSCCATYEPVDFQASLYTFFKNSETTKTERHTKNVTLLSPKLLSSLTNNRCDWWQCSWVSGIISSAN